MNALTPPIDQDRTLRALDSLGVLHRLPRQLWESLAENQGTALLLAEAVLLAVGCIPDPVDEQVRNVQECQRESVPAVGGRIVVGQVDCAVAVAQGHTGQIPEDEHEAPFLIVHIPEDRSVTLLNNPIEKKPVLPCRDDAFLAF